MHRLQQLLIFDLHVLAVNAHGQFLVVSADPGAFAQRHEKCLELSRSLLDQLTARRNIAAGRIDAGIVEIREDGKLHPSISQLQNVVLRP